MPWKSTVVLIKWKAWGGSIWKKSIILHIWQWVLQSQSAQSLGLILISTNASSHHSNDKRVYIIATPTLSYSVGPELCKEAL